MIKLLSKNETEFKVELNLNKEEWAKYSEEAYETTKNKFSVAGFRKGKVPKSIIEKNYGDNVFFEEALNMAISKEYAKFLVANKEFEPYSHPEVSVKNVGVEGLVAELTTVLIPTVKLGIYKGLNIKRKDNNVSDTEVKEEIEKERNKLARFEASSEMSKNGDIVNINFEGFSEGVAFAGGKADNFDLELGSGQFIPGFEEQLISLKKGDNKDVVVKFPEEYQSADLAGKEAVFKCSVNEVKSKQLPVIDDAFAKDVSEFDTLVEYKKDIKAQIKTRKDKIADNELEEKIVEKIIDGSKFTINNVVVDEEREYLVEDITQKLSQQGLDIESYCKYFNKSQEDFMKEKKIEAEKIVKMRLVLREILSLEKISVDEDETIDTLVAMNVQHNLNKEAATKYFEKMDNEKKNALRGEAVMQKLLKFLVASNVI